MKKVLTALILLLLLVIPSISYAQSEASPSAEVKVEYESINPDSIFYPLKRTWEKFYLMIQFTENGRKEYMQKLIDIRFKELVYIAKNQKLSEFKQASSRYNSVIGEYTGKFSNTKDKIGQSAKSYSNILGELRKQYDSDFAYWSFLKSSQETSQELENN